MQLQQIFLPLIACLILACSKGDAEENTISTDDLNKVIAEKILAKTNTIRKSEGLDNLIQDDEMDVLATLHSENMINFDFFSHTDHQGKSPSNRANDLNYAWTRIAENIAYTPWFENVRGCGDTRSAESIAECVVEGWKNSPGHFANMIGDFKELGVGVVFTKDSVAYFTQVFRTR